VVWCPNYGGGYPWAPEGHSEGDAYTVYYPSDDSFCYVDWVGLDFYHNEFWTNQYTPLSAILGKPESSAVQFYQHFCDSLRKPMLFGETSTLESTRTNQVGDIQLWWIRTLYNDTTLSRQYPRLKGIVWFHVLKKEDMGGLYDWVDWRITDSCMPLYRQRLSSPYFLSSPDTGTTGTEDFRQKSPSPCLFIMPVQGSVVAEYSVRPAEHCRLSVFDAGGRRLAVATSQAGADGKGTASFSRISCAGVLLVRLESASTQTVAKTVIIR
jgi:hypothetical protein